MTNLADGRCDHADQVYTYALRALPQDEARAVEAHLATCARCTRELEALRPVVDALAACSQDVLHPTPALAERLARRIAAENAGAAGPSSQRAHTWVEPPWKDVAPGISCKLLSTDGERHVVSMLVRLAPGAEYPPHTHAGVEELHLLDGELWIDDRKLSPGDYNRGEPGTGDARVFSETGCTCVLITSTDDVLR